MNKDEVLRDNRLDTLIPWYIKAKLEHITNISFYEDNIDPTISDWEIRGNFYLMVHGDYDSFSERGISKLVMMLGFKPEGIFYVDEDKMAVAPADSLNNENNVND